MSATGRGPRLGGPDDVYRTPAWAVRRLLEAWTPPHGLTVEPGAGDGAIIKAVAGFEAGPGRPWCAIECRATARAALAEVAGQVLIADFLDLADISRDVAAVIANPPFHSAELFVRQACRLYPRAERAFLVRLGFLAGAERSQLWRDVGTPSVYVLPNRPSFTPDGKTDSADYAFLVFSTRAASFHVLNTTPLEERKQ